MDKKFTEFGFQKNRAHRFCLILIAATSGLGLSGCTRFGAEVLPKDRSAYNEAISSSWKEQTLLNIVKLRYLEAPVFLDVASIVSGYTLERNVSMSGQLSSSDAIQRNSFGGGAGARLTDRPTITYAPLTGERFNRQLLTPIPPDRILFLIQSGWPADLILEITTEAINGLRAQKTGGLSARAGDPGYYRVLELMREVQLSGAISMRIRESKDEGRSTALILRRNKIEEETIRAGQEIIQLLGLHPDIEEMVVEYGFIASGDSEISMATRSILTIMFEMAMQADVPVADTEAGFCAVALAEAKHRNFHIHVSEEEPEAASVAVFYRDHWFYIADNDLSSKRVFAFLMLLFSVTEGGANEGLPLVTIPAG
jgi:hypothetical protein